MKITAVLCRILINEYKLAGICASSRCFDSCQWRVCVCLEKDAATSRITNSGLITVENFNVLSSDNGRGEDEKRLSIVCGGGLEKVHDK